MPKFRCAKPERDTNYNAPCKITHWPKCGTGPAWRVMVPRAMVGISGVNIVRRHPKTHQD
jgi:hypothetical protein